MADEKERFVFLVLSAVWLHEGAVSIMAARKQNGAGTGMAK